jgi:hypothetical protein
MWHFDATVSNLVCIGETGGLLKAAMKTASMAAHAVAGAGASKGNARPQAGDYPIPLWVPSQHGKT